MLSDLVINAEVQSPAVQQENTKHVPTYIAKLAIIYGSTKVTFRARSVTVGDTSLKWKPTSNITIHNMRIYFPTKRKAFIEIGEDIKFVVLRHLTSYPTAKKMDFLGFYVEDGDGLSEYCHGLIGNNICNCVYLRISKKSY